MDDIIHSSSIEESAVFIGCKVKPRQINASLIASAAHFTSLGLREESKRHRQSAGTLTLQQVRGFLVLHP